MPADLCWQQVEENGNVKGEGGHEQQNDKTAVLHSAKKGRSSGIARWR
jgi:hypothetical protein